MASRFSISATFGAIDKMTKPLRKMANANNRFTKQIQRDYRMATRSADRFRRSAGKRMNNAMKRTAQVGGVALAAGIGLVAREYVKFDDSITAASAKFQDLNLSTKEGQQTLEEMRKVARKVGAETQFSATQAAQGLEFLAMAGFTTAQAMALLPDVVDLATVANVDLGRATDIASDTLGAFNLNTKDSIQLQKNLARVNDVSAKTTSMFNTNLELLFESVKKGGPTFTAAGQSIETFSTLAGVMAESGVKGGESGTQLRNMMLRLANPTSNAAGLMSNMGVRIKDSEGNFRNVIDIMADFQNGLKGMGSVQRTQTLATIFGARSVTGMNILLAKGTIELKKYEEQLKNSGGAAAKMAKIIRQSLGNKIKSLMSAATELGFRILQAFDGDARTGLDSFTKAIREFNVKPIVEGLKIVIGTIKFFWAVISPLLPFIITLVAAFKLYNIIMASVALANLLFGTTLALATLPVTLILIGVALLVALFIKLVIWSGGVKNAFINLGKIIMKALLLPVNLVISEIKLILFLASKLPGVVGRKAKSAFDKVKGFQDKMNKPFELKSGADLKKEAATGKGPVTQRDSIQKSITERNTTSNVTIRNESNNPVDAIGQRLLTGQKTQLEPSG